MKRRHSNTVMLDRLQEEAGQGFKPNGYTVRRSEQEGYDWVGIVPVKARADKPWVRVIAKSGKYLVYGYTRPGLGTCALSGASSPDIDGALVLAHEFLAEQAVMAIASGRKRITR